MLLYREDWAEAREMLSAWWRGDDMPRPAMLVTAPLPKTRHHMPPPPEPATIQDAWLNPDVVIGRAQAWMASTHYAGEAYPHLWVNIGPGIAATYVGSEPTFAETTVWFGRNAHMEWDEIEAIQFDPDNRWWNATKRLVAAAAACGKGRYITGMTDLGGVLDILASLRGTMNLLTDLVDQPDRVVRATDMLANLWHRYYDELDQLIAPSQEGTSAWMGIWCPSRWYPIQCDFSAMISPGMFAEFVLPSLREQCRRLDHTIYHWDGPGQIPHLDHLLGIAELDGIQWTPGEGNPDLADPVWFPLYRRILDAGKRLVLLGMAPGAIEGFLRQIPHQGVLITSWASSPEEADALVRNAELRCRP